MRLIPDVEPHMQGRRDYVSEDGQWKLSRKRVKQDDFRWKVQRRNGDCWLTLATFRKRRDARNHLEDLAGPPIDEEHDERCDTCRETARATPKLVGFLTGAPHPLHRLRSST